MNREIQKRLRWIHLYEETGNAGLVCRQCGVSRPTLRMWWRRYKDYGDAGLARLSKRPQHSPNRKVWSSEELHILEIKRTRNLGARRIQSDLRQHFNISLALATIHKVLSRHVVKPLIQHRQKSGFVRYENPTA